MQKSRFTAKQESAAAAFKNVLISWRERKIEIFYTTNAAEPRQKKFKMVSIPQQQQYFQENISFWTSSRLTKYFCVCTGIYANKKSVKL